MTSPASNATSTFELIARAATSTPESIRSVGSFFATPGSISTTSAETIFRYERAWKRKAHFVRLHASMNNIVAVDLPKEMQSHHYPILYRVEETHWWYVGRRQI